MPAFPLDVLARRSSSMAAADNRRAFDPEGGGLAISRPRSTLGMELWDVELVRIRKEDFAIFQAWVRDDLGEGSLPWTWSHPVSGADATWQFEPDAEPYRATFEGAGWINVSFRARVLA